MKLRRVAAGLTAGVLSATGLIASAEPSTAIIGGTKSTETYPWMGSLQSFDANHGCGTSLIAEEWALTAAHCLDNVGPGQAQVRFGSNNHKTGGTVVGIAEIHRAPGSGGFHFGADAALLRLDQPLTNTPVKLAAESPAVGTPTRLIGWGITCQNSLPPIAFCGQPPEQLREVNLAISHDAQCLSLIGGINAETELCVGGYFQNKGACYGDSGGPSVSQVAGEWQLTGITSRSGQVILWGQCGYTPTIYTDATAFRDWIRDTTGIPTI